MDAEFCGQLTLNRKSHVGLYLGSRCLIGSFPPTLSAASLVTEPVTGAYRQRFDQKVGGDRLNIAFQWAGTMAAGPAADARDQGELYLATFLPNAPYAQRSLLASRAVLLVSLAAAMITIVLSLFLSRNITNPIAALLAGMEKLKAGAFDTRVGPVSAVGGPFALFPRRGQRGGTRSAGSSGDSTRWPGSWPRTSRKCRSTSQYNEKIISSIKAGIAIVNGELVVEKANGTFLETFSLDGRAVTGCPSPGWTSTSWTRRSWRRSSPCCKAAPPPSPRSSARQAAGSSRSSSTPSSAPAALRRTHGMPWRGSRRAACSWRRTSARKPSWKRRSSRRRSCPPSACSPPGWPTRSTTRWARSLPTCRTSSTKRRATPARCP